MNTLVRESHESYLKPLIMVACVLLVAALLPSDMEREQILLVLFASTVPAIYYSDRSEKSKLLVAFTFFLGLLAIKYVIFKIHVWQLYWEWFNPGGLFGWQIKIDPFLRAIPFNDGMWLRQFRTPELDSIMVPVYTHGFTVPLLVLCIYFVLSHRGDRIVHALFATHAVQYLFILPFHFWVDGHQVWLVQNIYDGTTFMDPIFEHRHYGVPTIPSLNHVFPSMHTSIATALIILAWREKDRLLKWTFVTFNTLVIISTVYLGIHWVVDVAGGILFGWATVKFADWMVRREKIRKLIQWSENKAHELWKMGKEGRAYGQRMDY